MSSLMALRQRGDGRNALDEAPSPLAALAPTTSALRKRRLLVRQKGLISFLCIVILYQLPFLRFRYDYDLPIHRSPPPVQVLFYLDPATKRYVTRIIDERISYAKSNAATDLHSRDAETMSWKLNAGKGDDVVDDDDVCVPMNDWQRANLVTCNNVHEIDMLPSSDNDRVTFVNCGSERCAFRIGDDSKFSVVIKARRFHYMESLSPNTYEHANTDSVALERLTSSPYVSDIYGSCATSQIVEFASGGNLHDFIKISRKQRDGEYASPLTRLKIGYQIMTAVAHMHSLERDGMPSMTHNDVCCHQFILADGVYKLNDFFQASFLTKDKNTGEVCEKNPRLRMYRSMMKLRAPEELYYHFHGPDNKRSQVRRDKVDVWFAGNVLYYILTNKWLFEGRSSASANEKSMNGELSPFSLEIANSTNAATQALYQAVRMCWTLNGLERPAATDISDYLKAAIKKIEGLKEDEDFGIPRVSVPPLPEGHRHTDSDFRDNM